MDEVRIYAKIGIPFKNPACISGFGIYEVFSDEIIGKMVTELLNKYIWLVQKFITAGDTGLSLGEITGAWERKFGTAYSRRSFNNHREAIAEVFGIEIECNRSTRRYFVRDSGEISDRDAGIAWLIDTFTVNNMLSLAKGRLSGRISVEEVPSGKKYLTPLMNAMQEGNIVRILYRKYGAAEAETRRIHPYGIKESASRWYLVGWSEKRESCRVFALDRIERLEILPETFSMPSGFDIDALFATSFGTYLSDRPGQQIVFRAFGTESSYIRDLPLHHTQTVIKEDEKSVTFSIFASPNNSLYLELLGHGPNIEVLEPDEARLRMKELTREMDKLYSGKTTKTE